MEPGLPQTWIGLAVALAAGLLIGIERERRKSQQGEAGWIPQDGETVGRHLVQVDDAHRAMTFEQVLGNEPPVIRVSPAAACQDTRAEGERGNVCRRNLEAHGAPRSPTALARTRNAWEAR